MPTTPDLPAEDDQPVRILLAGATGVIGRRIVPLLIERGHAVTGLVRPSADTTELIALGASVTVADVLDAAAVVAAVRTVAPDVVLHQLTDLSRGSESNAAMRKTGTRNLTDAAHVAGVRRMVTQSVAWAYAGGDRPATEETPLDLTAGKPRLTTVEGVATLERIVREMPEWVVLRYGLFYGPGTAYWPDGEAADRVRAGEIAADEDVSSFVHIDDAAQAAVEALSWPSGLVNICDDEPAPGVDWVPAFGQAVGAPPPPRVTGLARHAWARGADNRHAREDLGWTPRFPSWRQGFTQA